MTAFSCATDSLPKAVACAAWPPVPFARAAGVPLDSRTSVRRFVRPDCPFVAPAPPPVVHPVHLVHSVHPAFVAQPSPAVLPVHLVHSVHSVHPLLPQPALAALKPSPPPASSALWPCS